MIMTDETTKPGPLTGGAVHDSLQRARDAAGNAANRLGEARDAAGPYVEAGRKRAADAYAVSKEVYSDVRDRGYRAADRTNRLIQEHPLAAAAIAVAAGAVVAAMFPKVRRGIGIGARAAAPKVIPAARTVTETLVAGLGLGASIARAAAGAAASKAAEHIDTDAIKGKAKELARDTGRAAVALANDARLAALHKIEEIDTDALKARARTIAGKARDAAASRIADIDQEAIKAQAKDIAVRAGHAAADAAVQAREVIAKAARRGKGGAG
jgi:ElaB/YqjD/DUF883 family membrane-anchored ribosome-binding protein